MYDMQNRIKAIRHVKLKSTTSNAKETIEHV